MIETNEIKKNGNEIIRPNYGLSVQIWPDSIIIELPSLEEIDQLKIKGEEHINVKTVVTDRLRIEELLNEQKVDLEKHYEQLKSSDKYIYRLATLHESTGNLDKALELLTKIKDNSSYYKTQYATFMLKKDVNLGIELLQQTNNEDSLIDLSLAYLQTKDLLKAKNTIESAYIKSQFKYKINSVYALIKIIGSELRDAIVLLKEIINYEKATYSTYYLLSLCYYYLRQYEKSYINIRIALDLNRNNLDIVILYSEISAKFEKYGDAVNSLESVINNNSSNEQLWLTIANYYFKMKKMENSKKALNAVIALNEKNGAAWNTLAIIYANQNEKIKANKYFNQAVKYSNGNLKILINYLRFLLQHKEYSSIEILCNEFLGYINSSIGKIELELIQIYLFSLKQQNKNESFIEYIIKIKTTKLYNYEIALVLHNYMICYYCSENKQKEIVYELINEITKCISENQVKNDEFEKSINNIAFAYLEFDDLSMAEKFIIKLSSRLGNNPFFNATYGLYYFHKGNNKMGEYYYEKAIMYSVDNELKKLLIRKRDLEYVKYYFKNKMYKNAKKLIDKISVTDDFISKEALKYRM
jgi:Tfp pilus assembly protein PilF